MRSAGSWRRLTASVAVGVLVLGACGRGSQVTSNAAQVDEVYIFSSLAEMPAASDAIVEGNVISVEPGRTIGGAPGEEPAGQFTLVTLKIDRVLYGSVLGDTIQLEEGFGIPPENSNEGDSGIYFVHLKQEKTDQPYYRFINSQGGFVESDDGKVIASNDEMSWVKDLESLTFVEFEQEVEAAIDEAKNG